MMNFVVDQLNATQNLEDEENEIDDEEEEDMVTDFGPLSIQEFSNIKRRDYSSDQEDYNEDGEELVTFDGSEVGDFEEEKRAYRQQQQQQQQQQQYQSNRNSSNNSPVVLSSINTSNKMKKRPSLSSTTSSNPGLGSPRGRGGYYQNQPHSPDIFPSPRKKRSPLNPVGGGSHFSNFPNSSPPPPTLSSSQSMMVGGGIGRMRQQQQQQKKGRRGNEDTQQQQQQQLSSSMNLSELVKRSPQFQNQMRSKKKNKTISLESPI